MKTKQEILQALARTGEERLLLAGLLDKEQACAKRGYLTHTHFLDMAGRAKCMDAVRLAGAQEHTLFWGGYEDAERVLAIFYPDYMTEQDARAAAPLSLLRAHKHAGDSLTHRDYLGSMMGLRIERDTVGDILVHDEGADIIALCDMADFLQLNLSHAGRKRVEMTHEPLESLRCAPAEERAGEGSVASPRLDSVAALVFGLPRAQVQELIARGMVFLNNLPCEKAERMVCEGDRLTVRGVGRGRIVSFGGVSRKGRQFISFVRNG